MIADTASRKFLFICHRVPYPPDKGDRIRSYRILELLAKHGEVDLAFLTDEPPPENTANYLQSVCRQTASEHVGGFVRWIPAGWFLLTGRSVTEGLFHTRRLQATVDRWLQNTRYDAVVCFSSSVLQYVRGKGLEDRLVVDLVDVDSQKWFDYAPSAKLPLRWLFRREGHRVRRIEQEAGQAKAVVLITNAEAQLYRRTNEAANVVVVPNGVDLTHIAPQAVAERPSIVFIGYLDYRANVLGLQWFCKHVWPRTRARFPEATFEIVGRNPIAAVEQLGDTPGVHVVGPVPDIRSYLAEARLVVVPLQVARGIQNKVLEAMSAGKTVIASPQALEGIDLAIGQDAIAAGSPDEWVEAIDLLWESAERRQAIGRAARSFVERNHDWDSCLLPLSRELIGDSELAGSSSATGTMHA